MKKRLIAVLMCAVMITVLGAGCGSKKEDTKETSDTKKEYTEDELKDSMKGVKLKVGTTGLFGPFTYYDEDGKTLIGYDVDLLNDLQELLEKQYGYEVLHITEAFDMKEGCLERSRAYNYAEPVIAAALEEHPSIQVVLDVHRDGVAEGTHLVTEVNGKPTAQIMFFNGLSRTKESGELTSLPNPYQAENLAFSFQMEYEAKQYYPGFSRCIYLKGYRYNLHLRPRSVLLEVGAQTNTVEEVKNAMGPFADILHKVLSGKSPASGG